MDVQHSKNNLLIFITAIHKYKDWKMGLDLIEYDYLN